MISSPCLCFFRPWVSIFLPFLTILPIPFRHVGSHCKHINKRWVNTLRINKEPRGQVRSSVSVSLEATRAKNGFCWGEKKSMIFRSSTWLADVAIPSLSGGSRQNNHIAPQSCKFGFPPFVQAEVLFLPPAKGQLPAPLGGIVSF